MLLIMMPLAVCMLPIDTAQAREPVDVKVLAAYQPHVFPAAQGKDSSGNPGIDLPYRLLAPSQVKPGKKYPLVLFLHGSGERGTDNKIQLKHGAADFWKRRDRFPAYVVFVQCPKANYWVNGRWGNKTGKHDFPDAASPAMAQALSLVDSLSDSLPVDLDRRYVCGLSMGGLGAWFAAADPPQRFAAAVVLCGGGDPTWTSRYTGVAIWALHGSKDNVVPPERGREMVTGLIKSGHHPEVRYTEYPDSGHDIWTRTFARDDLYEWLFDQSR